MSDTELEVLRDIISDLGGTGDFETVVPALKKIQELLAAGGGGTVADGSITTPKLASSAVTIDKISHNAKQELTSAILYATDATTAQTLAALGFTATVLTPQGAYSTVDAYGLTPQMSTRSALCWIDTTSGYLEKAPIDFSGNLQSQTITLWAKGLFSKATGVLGVDDSWTISSL